jgi:glutathione S-transferase
MGSPHSRLFLYALALSAPLPCHGFSNPTKNSIVEYFQRQGDTRPQPKALQDSSLLLKELGLTKSAEPALASARLEQIPTLLACSIVSVLRAASGVFGLDYKLSFVPQEKTKYTYLSLGDRYQLDETCFCRAPDLPIILYDNESCPLCRPVRETCSMLSLQVRMRPTPRNSRRFRPEIESRYGKTASFPLMIDPNNRAEIFESDKIIEYLFDKYGRGRIPWTLRNSPMVTATCGIGLLARFGAGGSYRDSKLPADPLILWGYEGSPFFKIVREALNSLELEHTVNYTPRGSLMRQKLFEKTGRFQVPYLEDPNTGVALFESEAIIEYINKMYSVDSTPVQYM